MTDRLSGTDVEARGGASPLGQAALCLTVGLLAVYGLFFIYSTGYIGDAYPVRPNWQRQIVWLGIGSVLGWLLSRWDIRRDDWRLAVWLGYGVCVASLVLVLSVGVKIGGARRWLAAGPLFVQPAEFAKLFTLLATAQVLGHPSWRWPVRWGVLLLVVLAPFMLILAEPSFGNAFALLPAVFALVFFCVLPLWCWRAMLFLLVLAALVMSAGLAWLRHNPPAFLEEGQAASSQKTMFFHDYHIRRLRSFLNPQGGWNERQAVMTLAGGGVLGKGYLQGTMKGLGYLPRTVAPTDFIFSVIGEEAGLLRGTLPVLLLYGILVSLGLHWAGHAADLRSTLTGVALVMLLATHVLVNVGMTVRLIPVIGLPLPLLSYGGSFTLATLMGIGIMAGIARQRGQPAPGESDGASRQWRLGNLLTIKISRLEGTSRHDAP
ncbi:MAG: FtsW/RodA/SpoVE family cell cycle protein [Lentisphaerae bacterium]|nr:FtsW/RodA/SpoVE family cell cycle protein [Lentisphaerota bacterium]